MRVLFQRRMIGIDDSRCKGNTPPSLPLGTVAVNVVLPIVIVSRTVGRPRSVHLKKQEYVNEQGKIDAVGGVYWPLLSV